MTDPFAQYEERRRQVARDGLTLLNIAREAISDAETISDSSTAAHVSAPGEADPGEFYVSYNGVDYAIRIEEI